MKTTLKIGFLAAGLLAARAQAKEVITYDAPQAYPEGIAYDGKEGRFLVSSMHAGVVGSVTRKGQYAPFIQDDSLISSVGLMVDAKSNRLFVCVSDPGVGVASTATTQGKLARLAIFDMKTKQRLNVIDLGALAPAGGHFANDLAMDKKGNVYVTDSFSPIIYKVDSSGQASIFLQDDMFKGDGFNLNGIVVHPKGYLLVDKYNTGDIYKISLDNPRAISKVAVPQSFPGADGLLLDGDDALIVVQNNGANKVVKLKTRDDWKTAEVASTMSDHFEFPTTATRASGKVYVNNARLGEIFDPNSPKDRTQFSIEEVEFKSTKK